MSDYLEFAETAGAGELRPAPGLPMLVRHTAGGRIWLAYEHLRAHEAMLAWADVPALHAMRIDAKRLRYTLESFREVLPAGWMPSSRASCALQDHLGNAQRRRCRLDHGPGLPDDQRRPFRASDPGGRQPVPDVTGGDGGIPAQGPANGLAAHRGAPDAACHREHHRRHLACLAVAGAAPTGRAERGSLERLVTSTLAGSMATWAKPDGPGGSSAFASSARSCRIMSGVGAMSARSQHTRPWARRRGDDDHRTFGELDTGGVEDLEPQRPWPCDRLRREGADLPGVGQRPVHGRVDGRRDIEPGHAVKGPDDAHGRERERWVEPRQVRDRATGNEWPFPTRDHARHWVDAGAEDDLTGRAGTARTCRLRDNRPHHPLAVGTRWSAPARTGPETVPRLGSEPPPCLGAAWLPAVSELPVVGARVLLASHLLRIRDAPPSAVSPGMRRHARTAGRHPDARVEPRTCLWHGRPLVSRTRDT